MSKAVAEPKKIGFSEAYEELKTITDTLNGEQVEADELVGLLRRGKGLEAALRTKLTSIEQEVEAIESGKGIDVYEIVATEAPEPNPATDVPADTSGFDEAGISSSPGNGEDIPF